MSPPSQATKMTANSDGSVCVAYTPLRSGVHEVNMSFNEKNVTGVPIRLNVDAQDSKHYVTAYGGGLNQGKSGETLHFYVTGNTKDVEVAIDGPGKVDVVKKEDFHGAVRFDYLALNPGEYNVHIKHKGKAIHGSPFAAKLSGEGRKRSQVASAGTSVYVLGAQNTDLSNTTGLIKTPTGSSELCLLKKIDNKLAIASFQPRKKGAYKVEVSQDGKPIKDSPFTINVNDQHVCSATKVKLHGAVSEATANTWNEVQVDISQAGYGSLAISIEGGHRSDMDLSHSSETDYLLKFKPHEPGVYLLNIKFGDEHVVGSPHMVSVGGVASGRIRETAVIPVKATEIAEKNKDCHLELLVPGTDPLEMEATITTPSGQSELCEIRGLGDNLCSLKFKPNQDGVNNISLKYKGLHFAGSPFQYTVGKAPSGGTHRIEFGGPGVEQGEVDSKNEFNVYYREGGAGSISIAIEGPSKAVIKVVDKGTGYLNVCYVVTKEGDYGVHVKFNDEHVPESPAMVRVLPLSRDAKKVSFTSLRDRGIDVDKAVTFQAVLNGAIGTLRSHVHTPSGEVEDVYVTELDDDKFALRFTPKENGVFYVDVKLNEAHVPGSPLPFLVGKQMLDPALVVANGAGLEKAVAGKPTKFTVVTANAGAGALVIQIDGPSKVVLVCSEAEDGYNLTYTPQAAGVYMVMIKFCNVTIAGAPFRAEVTGEGLGSEITETSSLTVETVEKKLGQSKTPKFNGDAEKVVAKGIGLQKGHTNRSAAFTLDVKGAGNALLAVGMISPKGNPVTELSYKKIKPTMYNISYTANEKGPHVMSIRWGEEHIHGSPFEISVV